MSKRSTRKKPTSTADKKPTLLTRRPLAVRVLASGRVPPSAHIVYEETWIEEGPQGQYTTTKLAIGNPLRTLPDTCDLNPRGKHDKVRKETQLFPEFFDMLAATSLLLQNIERICLDIDRKLGLETK